MDYASRIEKRWRELIFEVMSDEKYSLMSSTDFTLGQYKSYLLETYFHVRENPFSQMLSAQSLSRVDNHRLFKKYILHAADEITHDLLALTDYKRLGGDESLIQGSPLQTTTDLIKYTYDIAKQDTMIPYLGYLYHVELMPIENGQKYIDLLKLKGIPENCFSFIAEHAKVDIEHHELMKFYISQTVKNDNDFNLFLKSMEEGIYNHSDMIIGALKRPLA